MLKSASAKVMLTQNLARPKKGGSVKSKNAKELATEFKAKQTEALRRFKPRPSGKLSDDQLALAKKVFAEIDKDKSGTVDVDELIAWFKLAGKDIKKTEVQKLMEEYDNSQDCRIDLREFLDIFVMAMSPSSQREEATESIKEVIAAYGDKGQIKKAEFIRLLNEQYGLEVDASFVDGLMKEAWKGSAKGTISDLEDSLDEFLTLEELQRALGV